MVAELRELRDLDVSEMDWEDPMDPPSQSLIGVQQRLQMFTPHVSTKIPPSYDGLTSWFSWQSQVEDWLDLTELEAVKQGPALKSRLLGEAAVFKEPLDRDTLKLQDGATYLLRELRPHFFKNNSAVFLLSLIHI